MTVEYTKSKQVFDLIKLLHALGLPITPTVLVKDLNGTPQQPVFLEFNI